MRTFQIIISAVLLFTMLGLPPSASAASDSVYTVQAGDSLSSIAARYGVSVQTITQANGLASPNQIWVGQPLTIPGQANPSASAPAAPAATGGTRYTVRRGDTLGSIAARYGVSAAAIARANGITNPNMIRVGSVLIIPGASKSSAGGASTGSSAVTSGKGPRFVVNITQQRCWLYSNGAVQYAWRCSTGRRGAPTMPGTFKIRSKLARAWGGTWGFWMPYWLGLYMAGSLENGIHGFPYSPAGKKSWTNMIGRPITFGCVMLDDAAAKTLWNVAYVGMPVTITY